jgi:tetratricopeptide (TPR) repeat protein
VDTDTALQEAHALWRQADYEGAERTLRAIVRHDPAHVDATHELGALLVHVGQHQLGVSVLKRAATLDPSASRLNALGLAHVAAGDLAQALTAFRAAVGVDAEFAEGYNSLGRVLAHAGHIEPAAGALARALQLDEYSASAWDRFCAALREASSPGANDLLADEIARGLSIAGAHRAELVTFAIGIVTADTALQVILRAAALGEMETVRANLMGDAVARVMDGSLMARLLAVGVLPSRPYETLFTELRRRFALDIHAGQFGANHDKLPFLCGLARQCFLNGYAWHEQDDEFAAVRALVGETAAEIESPTPTTPLRIAILAAYAPLSALPYAAGIARYADAQASPELHDLVLAQIEEPERELRLLAGDAASAGELRGGARVRWVDPPPMQPVALTAMLGLRFPDLRREGFSGLDSPRILVHGCGPGKDAIAWARNVENASVVGVEQNPAELGFARRKAEELGQANVEFAAAPPEGGFDLVACPMLRGSGGDAASALGALVDCVRPGGLLHVSIRAEASRPHITAVREFAREGGYDDTAAGIRACRRAFLALPDETEWKGVSTHFDVHTRAGCHALFFDDGSPYTTIPALAAALEAHSVEFLGFEDEGALAAYRNTFPRDETARDLDAWAKLEGDAPALFMPVYTFWARTAA